MTTHWILKLHFFDIYTATGAIRDKLAYKHICTIMNQFIFLCFFHKTYPDSSRLKMYLLPSKLQLYFIYLYIIYIYLYIFIYIYSYLHI